MMRKILMILGIWILIPVMLFSDVKLPKHTGNPVNDFANVIPESHERKLNYLAQEVYQKTGVAIVVVTVKNMNGGSVEEYASRLFREWGIGRKGSDEGLLFFLSMEERRIKIEVGYGLESIIPDGKAGEILDQYVLPELKSGNFGRGFYLGMAKSAEIIAKDKGIKITGMPVVTRGASGRAQRGRRGGIFPIIVIVFLIIVTRGRIIPWLFLGLLMGGGGGRSSGFGGGGFGGGFGGFDGGMSGGGGASRGF